MPLIEETYQQYLQKVDKNGTNDNIATDRGRYVNLFNENQNKWIEVHLQNRGIDDVRYIQKFLVLDKKISDSSQTFDHFDFSLPDNYLDLSDIRAEAKKKECKAILDLFEIRTENLNTVLNNKDTEPSFKWREAPYTINSDKVSIYTNNDFTINHILLDYYRYPNKISLVNPYDPESNFDESTEIEWDDKSLNRIISLCAGEFEINQENPNFQLQFLRTQK